MVHKPPKGRQTSGQRSTQIAADRNVTTQGSTNSNSSTQVAAYRTGTAPQARPTDRKCSTKVAADMDKTTHPHTSTQPNETKIKVSPNSPHQPRVSASLGPEEEHRKPSGVHSTQTVRLPEFERQGPVFAEADFAGDRVCMRTGQRGKKWERVKETYQQ